MNDKTYRLKEPPNTLRRYRLWTPAMIRTAPVEENASSSSFIHFGFRCHNFDPVV